MTLLSHKVALRSFPTPRYHAKIIELVTSSNYLQLAILGSTRGSWHRYERSKKLITRPYYERNKDATNGTKGNWMAKRLQCQGHQIGMAQLCCHREAPPQQPRTAPTARRGGSGGGGSADRTGPGHGQKGRRQEGALERAVQCLRGRILLGEQNMEIITWSITFSMRTGGRHVENMWTLAIPVYTAGCRRKREKCLLTR